MTPPDRLLPDPLSYLKLAYFLDQHRPLADQAARESWSHGDYLARLAEGGVHQRQEQSLRRRLRLARLPWVKTLDQFQWSWPKKINRLQVQNLFTLGFLEKHTNVVFCGGVGLGTNPSGRRPDPHGLCGRSFSPLRSGR